MGQLLGCLGMLLFVGFFVVVSLGVSFLHTISRFLTGNGFRKSHKEEIRQTNEPSAQTKVFSDDEGEYVDFEEV
ncbi:MAG: DUF4834 family protein [Bacteroidaceae bacterium]|nr:DUF4834 family protein [Bacteroidaceae bacterium]